jgi:hypothetical protein
MSLEVSARGRHVSIPGRNVDGSEKVFKEVPLAFGDRFYRRPMIRLEGNPMVAHAIMLKEIAVVSK